LIQKKQKLGKCALLAAFTVGFAGTSSAAQFDAPCCELEKKFGKKPNGIYILSTNYTYTGGNNEK